MAFHITLRLGFLALLVFPFSAWGQPQQDSPEDRFESLLKQARQESILQRDKDYEVVDNQFFGEPSTYEIEDQILLDQEKVRRPAENFKNADDSLKIEELDSQFNGES